MAEYECFVVDSLTEDVVATLPWAAIDWQRVRNDSAVGSVKCDQWKLRAVMPDPPTCWGQMLVIERDSIRVWDGPITGWSSGAQVEIIAADRSRVLDRRLLTIDIDWGASDLSNVTNDMRLAFDSGPEPNPILTGLPYRVHGIESLRANGGGGVYNIDTNGVWRVEHLRSIRQHFDDLAADVFFNWTTVCHRLYMYVNSLIWTGTDPSGFPSFDPEFHVMQPPTIDEMVVMGGLGDVQVAAQGGDLATVVYKGETGQGVAGFPNPVPGSNFLTYVPYALQVALSDAEAGVGAFYDGLLLEQVYPGQFPQAAPLITLEQIVLHPSVYAEGFDELIPGVICPIDLPNSWGLNHPTVTHLGEQGLISSWFSDRINYGRLEQLTVQVIKQDGGAVSESVSASFEARAVAA